MLFRRFGTLVVWTGIAVLLTLLAIGLPSDGFFVGDSGVKLIAVRNALAHPLRPLDIDVIVIGGAPAFDLLDPFFVPHAGHAHAETSPIFPLISAPFFALFGLRGLQILPLAGFLGVLAALPLLARRLGEPTSVAATLAFGLISCPLLFYGLEFWEHSVAAALALFGTVLFVTTPRSGARLLLSGVLLGAAVLTRPEALWYVTALLAADRVLAAPIHLREFGSVAAGLALVIAPFAAVNAIHFQNLVGPHVALNAAGIAPRWLDARVALLREWFGPGSWLAGAALAAAILAGALARGVPRARWLMRAIVLVASCVVAAMAVRRGVPRESVWAVFPAAALLFVPTPQTAPRALRFLLYLILLDTVLVLLSAPNNGGGQWGPRYLMLAGGPAVLALWFVVRDIVAERRVAEVLAVGLLLALTALVQRQAYKELRAAKQHYSGLQRALFAETQTMPVLTDLWWLDQVAAARTQTPVFLFAGDAKKAADAVGRLAAAHVDTFAIVTTSTAQPTADVLRWLDGTEFHLDSRRVLPEASLIVFRIQASPHDRR